MKKMTVCLTLVLAMLLSCVACAGIPAAAESAALADTSADSDPASVGADYGLAKDCRDGNILHCFNWTLSQIKAELPNIAKAGFTSVQTSPLQPHDGGRQWYWLYQPTNFTIGNEIGSYNDLKSLCSEADKYGIKVIVDVVANHLAGGNNGSWGGIDGSLRKSEYFHNMGPLEENSKNRYDITHKNIGMPDLNSEHTDIQNKVYAMAVSLKNAGVDGIRWDAAKHIGLPSEGCAFWSKMAGLGLYQYGEILDAPAGSSAPAVNNALMQEYASYIGVTDEPFSGDITQSFRDRKIDKSSGNWLENGVSADRLVYWGESHDTYCNDGWTNSLDQNVIDRAYAVLGARAGSQALYLSRPYEKSHTAINYAVKGSTHYTSAEVAAVNRFHNAMAGTDEQYAASSGCYVVCRGGGAVIVSLKSQDVDVSVSNAGSLAPAGTYTDEVSGSTWTVTASSIKGHIGSTGIAVIYDVNKIGQKNTIIGDSDLSGSVTVVDATAIQRHLASLQTLTPAALAAADSDRDGSVTVLDATAIQRYLVGLKDKTSHVGEYL